MICSSFHVPSNGMDRHFVEIRHHFMMAIIHSLLYISDAEITQGFASIDYTTVLVD